MLRKLTYATSLLVVAAFTAYLVGCNRGVQPEKADEQTQSNTSTGTQPTSSYNGHSPDEDHGHEPGQHGGIVISLGRDSYHVEAVFETEGILRLYMLGQDETRIQEVETQELTAYAKTDGSSESVSFQIKPAPQPDDAEGKTSQFVGELPEQLRGKAISVTVPSIRIAGERFRLGFTSTTTSHAGDQMPEKLPNAEEAKLFLTPGGIYTQADIEANGNVTGSQKFKGFQAAHDLKPKVGDKICPITLTKANPEVSWIIGGKKYEFCCPPCVAEFVALAKENPTEIKDPDDYVKS